MSRPRRPSPIPPDWNPLDSLSAESRERLTPKERRTVADLGASIQRKTRERSRVGLPGGAPCPPFLQRAEASAPGAARFYLAMDGERFSVARAVEAGAYLQLDADAVASVLDALRRDELIGDAPGGMVTLPPGGVPF